MKFNIWYLAIFFICALNQNILGQVDNNLSEEDSLLVLRKVYMYDFENNIFEDIDEMYLEKIWISKNIKAKDYFEKAIRLTTAPIHERMILASYFYHDKKLEPVRKVLETCRNANDTTTVYNIMNSYRIKFSDFEISQKQLDKYCKKCKYN
ncbi:hypothetical protein [Carboxylicivirga marina]|uniref:hypothetical protein n=1 Tax=Carboxylicivirga marina TaxID=2800988 RepID=UPI00259675ED|nr:hypothetical protein [uncultured Carboxylicivirga sp.]